MEFKPQLLSKAEVVDLLRVSDELVQSWLDDELIPFVQLGNGEYRIPLGGLQACMTFLPGLDLAE